MRLASLILLAGVAALPRAAAAQQVLRTSSDGVNGAYCVWTGADNAGTGVCNATYAAFRAQWSPSGRASGEIRISKSDGTCLDASGGPGRPVRTLRCTGGAAQAWTVHPSGQIESQQHAGQCLDVSGGVGANRTVALYGCDYAAVRRDNQRFALGAFRPLSSVSASTRATGSELERAGVRVDPRTAMAVAAGGANAVAAGGANVVAAGGANVIAPGGLN